MVRVVAVLVLLGLQGCGLAAAPTDACAAAIDP